MKDPMKKIENLFLLGTFFLSFLFILLLTFAKYPDWWSYVIFENTPLTWYESVLLFTCGVFSFLISMLFYLNNEKKPFVLWGLLSVFFIGLSLDERFALHERIRTLLLAPKDIKNPLFFWTEAGDFVLITLLLIALFFLPVYIKLFKVRKASFALFLTGFFIAALAVIADSISVKDYSIEFQRLQQYIEEILETTAMIFFLNSLFKMLTYEIRQYAIIRKTLS